MSLKERLAAFRARLPRWERKPAEPLPHGAAPLIWCILLSMIGVAALAGSTWMLLVFIVGSVGHFDWFSDFTAGSDGVTRFDWSFQMSVHWAMAIGLFLFCFAIAVFNATWIETRKHIHDGKFRLFVTVLGVVVALFMIAGATVVQQRGTDARARDEAVAVQTAQVGAASAQARLERAERRLREMRNHENQYMAVAATVGAAEFERSYLSPEQRARETPERVRLLERSLGAARQADALEAEIAALAGEVAAAQTGAAQAQSASVRAEGVMAGPVALIEDLRKPVTSTLGEILAFSAFSLALSAWASRKQRDDVRSGWAPDSLQVEDMRDQPAVEPGPVEIKTQVRATNAETGEEEILIKPKPYWRKARRGQPTPVDVQPELPDDEKGVLHDGGGRAGSVGAADEDAREAVSPSNEHDADNREEHVGGGSGVLAEQPITSANAEGQDGQEHDRQRDDLDLPEHAELSDEELAAYAEAELAADAPIVDPDAPEQNADSAEPDRQSEHVALPNSEGVLIAREEPEQYDAHVREREEAA